MVCYKGNVYVRKLVYADVRNALFSTVVGDEKEALCELQFKLLEDTRDNIFKVNDKEATQNLHKYLVDKNIKMDVSSLLVSA